MTMLPSFSDITYFLEVASTGNISRAAERLGIAQPSLSAAVKRLEQSLGVSLFVRGRSGVQLTKAGKELFQRGRVLLSDWERLRAQVHSRETCVSGKYVLGCHPSVAMYSLNLFLPRLVQTYPELEIQLVHDLSRKITEKVISFEVDFGIVVNPVRHPDIVISELCNDDVSFWTTSTSSSTQTLDSSNGVVVCDLELRQTQILLGRLQKRDSRFRRVIHSSSLEVIADLTSHGAGIGILPQRVAQMPGHHKLKQLNIGLPSVTDKICLVYRPDAQKSSASKQIIKAIKTSIL